MNLKSGELKKDYAYRRILEMILNDEVKEDHFPSEPEFCRQLGVARVTLRSALKRLEKEGYITRSHYYGTRINRDRTVKKLLIAANAPVFTTSKTSVLAELEIEQLTALCRERGILYETRRLYFLQDAKKLAERYFGIVFFGVALNGTEPFLKVLKESKVPTVYIREDENNLITDRFASIGPNIRKAWTAGIGVLTHLGLRRIATLINKDSRSFQRLGFDSNTFADFLREQGLEEAAGMVCDIASPELFEEKVRYLIEEKNPEAFYCYSDYFSAMLYPVLQSLGKRIPQDVAVLSFGIGSDLLTPTLSAVHLYSPIFGQTVLELLQYLQKNPGQVPCIELPFHILEKDSTAKIRLDGMPDQNRKKIDSTC